VGIVNRLFHAWQASHNFKLRGRWRKMLQCGKNHLKCGEKWRLLHYPVTKKSKMGRPKGKRLTKKLGLELDQFLKEKVREKRQDFIKQAGVATNYVQTFHENISNTLKIGFNIHNVASTVKRDLRGICTGKIPFRPDYGEAIKTILNCQLPSSIEDFLKERKSGYKATGVHSSFDTKEYFNHFFDYIKSDGQKKKVRIFARWINLEARKIMLKFGPHDLFQRFNEVFTQELLDVEYIFFLYSPASLKLPDVRKILKKYRQFASEIHLHYLSQTNLTPKETNETISIWNESERIFTHDWDFKGNVHNLIEWTSKNDCERLLKTYEKIKADSSLYFQRR
jgi:hypothetical protein